MPQPEVPPTSGRRGEVSLLAEKIKKMLEQKVIQRAALARDLLFLGFRIDTNTLRKPRGAEFTGFVRNLPLLYICLKNCTYV